MSHTRAPASNQRLPSAGVKLSTGVSPGDTYLSGEVRALQGKLELRRPNHP